MILVTIVETMIKVHHHHHHQQQQQHQQQHQQKRPCVIPNGGQNLMYLKVHYDKLVNGSKKYRPEYLLHHLTLFSVK